MMASIVVRLLLAIVLVVNGTGSAMASAAGLASGAPDSAVATSAASGAARGFPSGSDPVSSHGGHALTIPSASGVPALQGRDSRGDLPGCHEVVGEPAPVLSTADIPPAHGHCCHDACHCVCTLQAHALAALAAPVPRRTVAGLPPLQDWAAPDPALLLRPPIA